MLTFALLLVTPLTFVLSDPTPCCGNHKFMAQFYTFGASVLPTGPQDISDSQILYYDFDMKMTKSVSMDGEKVDYADYNHHRYYSIRDGVCYSGMMNETMTAPCIQSDASFEGTFKVGGRSAIMTNVWRKEMNDSSGNFLMTKTQVTANGCIPVSFSQYGNLGGVPHTSSFFFTDVTEGALTTGAFDIPKECVHLMPLPGAIGKRSLPFESIL